MNPGDDVLQFDLRLQLQRRAQSQSARANDDIYCFCLQGYACDPYFTTRRTRIDVDPTKRSQAFADDDMHRRIIHHHSNKHNNTVTRYYWLDQWYGFILPPVTKWDAARFLTLSVDPWARYPPADLGEHINDDDCAHTISNTTNSDGVCKNGSENVSEALTNNNKRFDASEQSHAFMPLLPLCIRYTSLLLTKFLPLRILPPTYEATSALSAIIINIAAFVIASLALYDLTLYMLMGDEVIASKREGRNSTNTINRNNLQAFQFLAKTTATLFCINPAGVFFTASYSESVFAMLTFSGHAVAARGRYYEHVAKGGEPSSWLLAKFYWIPTTLLWTMASYARSNGTFSSVWWMLIGLGNYFSYFLGGTSDIRGDRATTAFKCITTLLFHGVLGLLIAMPILYHDRRGYSFHCTHTTITPDWCECIDSDYTRNTPSRFSLYAYVQRKHWNVGLLRYYELKQIPNFLLALPVLILSFGGAVWWIQRSWKRHSEKFEGSIIRRVFQWAVLALSASSYETKQRHEGFKTSKDTTTNDSDILSNKQLSEMLVGPTFLAYYAILAGFALVGTFLAHVQISTRLICSSCPAFYWFVCALLVQYGGNDVGSANGQLSRRIPLILYGYFGLYNLLGVVMHVNWLPWT